MDLGSRIWTIQLKSGRLSTVDFDEGLYCDPIRDENEKMGEFG